MGRRGQGRAPMQALASQERCCQGRPRLHHRRLRRGYQGRDSSPEIVEAAAQVAQERVRPAERPRPGQRLEAAHRAQSPLQVLVIPLDALLDPFPDLMQDGREGRRQRGRVGGRAIGRYLVRDDPRGLEG
jgi:hypothetical protein